MTYYAYKKVHARANENESRVSTGDAEAFAHWQWHCESGRNRLGFGSERFKSDRVLYRPLAQYGGSLAEEELIGLGGFKEENKNGFNR